MRETQGEKEDHCKVCKKLAPQTFGLILIFQPTQSCYAEVWGLNSISIKLILMLQYLQRPGQCKTKQQPVAE